MTQYQNNEFFVENRFDEKDLTIYHNDENANDEIVFVDSVIMTKIQMSTQ